MRYTEVTSFSFLKTLVGLVYLVRPDQWIKNVLIFIPLFFSLQFTEIDSIRVSLFAFVVFVFAASTVYVMNDMKDASRDALHPQKKHRPIASGLISPELAFLFFVVLLLITLLSSWSLGVYFFSVITSYLILHVGYTYWLKDVLFVDVLTVAASYVFRVIAGAVVLGVAVSEWMIVLIFLLALWSVVSKRRQEIKVLQGRSKRTRKVLNLYSIDLLDQINSVIVPVLLVSYIFYTFQARIESYFMLSTIPIVIFWFFRALYLIKSTDFGLSSSDYKSDLQLVVAGTVWGILVFLALLGF